MPGQGQGQGQGRGAEPEPEPEPSEPSRASRAIGDRGAAGPQARVSSSTIGVHLQHGPAELQCGVRESFVRSITFSYAVCGAASQDEHRQRVTDR